MFYGNYCDRSRRRCEAIYSIKFDTDQIFAQRTSATSSEVLMHLFRIT